MKFNLTSFLEHLKKHLFSYVHTITIVNFWLSVAIFIAEFNTVAQDDSPGVSLPNVEGTVM